MEDISKWDTDYSRSTIGSSKSGWVYENAGYRTEGDRQSCRLMFNCKFPVINLPFWSCILFVWNQTFHLWHCSHSNSVNQNLFSTSLLFVNFIVENVRRRLSRKNSFKQFLTRVVFMLLICEYWKMFLWQPAEDVQASKSSFAFFT